MHIEMFKSFIISFMLLAAPIAATASDVNIIPRPQSVVSAKGVFNLRKTPLTYSIKGSTSEMLDTAMTALGVGKTSWKNATVKLSVGNAAPTDESYKLTVGTRSIDVEANSAEGAFYAIQSLGQLIDQYSSEGEIPAMKIVDSPRFPYRGMHFDVSRHFRPIEFLYKQVDAMARLKLNRMHLHLTDGAGWRIEIDSFPRLSTYAAWRPQRRWTDWTAEGSTYCDHTAPDAYGGYYTKKQLADLIRYAALRGITVIPEIEMPGHSEEVIAAYPWLGCDGATHSTDFCPGKESTFDFLEKVLDEVIELFPSQLIHIGGDEASKEHWKTCADCRKRMADEGLADVDELQSYLIKRIERHVNSRGRRIIGWDEILQGGVAPDATVMSWRGTEGGLAAINDGHDVIMTPGAFCYLDYSQDAPFREPASIGGYTPLEKVYSYEPLDPAITPDKAHHLLGVQGNLWAEYVTDDSHAEYMYYPRIYALAEIGWSSPEKDYPDFHRRALAFNSSMKQNGYSTFDLANEYGERRESLDTINHLGRGARVIYTTPYNNKYAAAGPTTLTDGIQGGWTYGDRRWQGWQGDMDLTVDLGEVKPLHAVNANFMHAEGAWVQLPEDVTWLVSNDGVEFTEVGTLSTDLDPKYPKITFRSYFLPLQTEARYVRLKTRSNPRVGSWQFLDEIVIN